MCTWCGMQNIKYIRSSNGPRWIATRLREHNGIFMFWSNARFSSTSGSNRGRGLFENMSMGSPITDRSIPGHAYREQDYIPVIRSIYPDMDASGSVLSTAFINAALFDQPERPKSLDPGESPLDFILDSTPTYTTMNPVHALRETLTNPLSLIHI